MRGFAAKPGYAGAAVHALPVLATLLLTTILALGALLPGVAPIARADSNGSLSIVTPAPQGNTSSGPVGTNVTMAGQQLNPNDTYTLGYATQDLGCDSGFRDLSGGPVAVNSDGTLSPNTTFVWPGEAGNAGTSYVICLKDTPQSGDHRSYVQSSTTFEVLDSSAPSITVKHPQVTPGTPTPTVHEDDTTYSTGEQILVSGKHFLPANTKLNAYLTQSAINTGSDLTTQLNVVGDPSSLTSDGSGKFTATLQLPDSSTLNAGQYYLYIVTGDGTQNALPSLVAFKQINVKVAPTATPTPSPTVRAAPTSTPAGTTTTGTGGNDHFGAIVGLGGLSILLFVIGVILLASVAAGPRPAR